MFAGNRRDAKTVPDVLRDLEQRFGLKRVVFVGDRGMVTSQNLDDLRDRAMATSSAAIAGAAAKCSTISRARPGHGSNARSASRRARRRTSPKTLVQEVSSKPAGVRVFVIHSEERRHSSGPSAPRQWSACAARLEKLERRIAKGRLKAAEKVGAAAARVLSRNHGHRYYDWSYEDGVFRFFEHPVHFAREQAYEGKYVIQTEEPNLSAIDAVRLYKELSEVERSFANLKDVIDMRPIYHQTDDRVEAHIFVAALAFLLHRAIEKKLKAARLDLSADRSIDRSQIRPRGRHRSRQWHHKTSVTPGTQRAAAVLRALGITDLDPPTPRNQARP